LRCCSCTKCFEETVGFEPANIEMTHKFALNAWYAAGFCDEFGAKPLMRTLLERDIVVYRTGGGELVALDDRCPHRFAPLHLGTVVDDALRCRYHGLEFGPGGRCVRNPSSDAPPPAALQVRSYPTAEIDGVVWIWIGDKAPEPDRISRWPEFSDGKHESVHGYLHIQAHYQLVIDNLLDLSHAEFLHPTLGAPGFNKKTRYTMEQKGDVVIANHWRPDVPLSSFFRTTYESDAPSRVDHRAISSWHPPSNVHVEVGVTAVGRDASEGPVTRAAHLITPESDGSCHYFWIMARNFRLGDAAFADSMQQAIQKAFETEDEPMIEAQYRNLKGKSFDELKPTLLPSDGATVRARRMLQRLLQQE